MRICELDAAVHQELQGSAVHLDSVLDFNAFISLIWATLSKFTIAHDVDSDLINFHFFDRLSLRRHVHAEAGHHILGWGGFMIERDDGHQVLPLGQFDAVAVWKACLSHLESCPAEEKWFSRT